MANISVDTRRRFKVYETLIIFVKSYAIDILQDSKYASVFLVFKRY